MQLKAACLSNYVWLFSGDQALRLNKFKRRRHDVRDKLTWGTGNSFKQYIIVDNKAREQMSKRVLQENKARQIFRETTFLTPDTQARVRIKG